MLTQGAYSEFIAPTALELDAIFLLGFDAWSDGLDLATYLDGCRKSEKYQKGLWHVLKRYEEIVCALIVYNSGFGLPEGSIGIGFISYLTETSE